MLRSYKGSTYTLGASSTIDYCVKEGGGEMTRTKTAKDVGKRLCVIRME